MSTLFVIALFFILWPIVWTPVGIVLAYSLRLNPLQSLSPLQKLPFVVSLYALAPLVLAAVLSWSNLSWVSVGVSRSDLLSGTFALGLGVSVVSIVSLFSLFWCLGWIQFNRHSLHRNSFQSEDASVPISPNENVSSVPLEPISSSLSPLVLIPSFLFLGVIVGGVEELIFRGFLTGQLWEICPVWMAGAIASLIFALLHLVWEGTENIPQLPGLWVMGMVLTVAWWIDDHAIALAWGLHAGWVWSVATFDALELVEYTHAVPAWVTGIDNRPLAGIMGVGALVLTGLGLELFL